MADTADGAARSWPMTAGRTPLGRWTRRAHTHLVMGRTGGLLAVATFGVTALVLALTRRYLHDEGLFTFELARGLWQEPEAVFFYEKGKPALMLLYALPSALGLTAFLLTHALVGTAAVALTLGAARRLGLEAASVAAWLLATSLGFTVATTSGYPNSDGCFFLALTLYLYVSQRRRGAAFVLGMLPLVRSELAVVTLLLLAWDLRAHRDWRFALRTLAFGAAYVLGGAVYHQDVLWLYDHFPNPQGLPPELRLYARPTVAEAATHLRRALLENSPFLASFGVFGLSRQRTASVLLFFAAAGIYVGETALQLLGRLGFDSSPRYYVTALPLIALLAAVALSPRERPSFAWTGAVALSLACATAGWSGVVLAAMVSLAAVWRIFGGDRQGPECALVAAAMVTLAVELAGSDGLERRQHEQTHELVARMRSTGIYRDQMLFTDIPAARFDRGAGIGDTMLLVNETTRWEMANAMNPANHQLDAFTRAMERGGWLVDPDRHVVRHDAVYALRDLERTRKWRERIEAERPTRVRLGDFWVYSWP